MIGMTVWITQLVPDSRQFRTDIHHRVVHKVIGPTTGFPAKLTILGLYTYDQPVDSRIIYRTLLQECHIGINVNIYTPYLSVRTN
jgi:hypothetical protein